LLEIGCGAGNFVFPLLEEASSHYFIYACDFSTRAVEIVKKHQLYDEAKVGFKHLSQV
jgi:methyltransferase-like protein 6